MTALLVIVPLFVVTAITGLVLWCDGVDHASRPHRLLAAGSRRLQAELGHAS